jgi:NAD(P)-dependent dehydrogenase (short-subunit alcohol dehydrogenase family)
VYLEAKTAIIYGAAGAIGSAVSHAFAREGATVFLGGRRLALLERLAGEIRAAGGQAHPIAVDATDEPGVNAAIDRVVAQTGRLDISFNLIGVGDVQQPLLEISLADFLQPVTHSLASQFITARAAARAMIPHRSGVILTFGGSGPQTPAGLGGFKVSLDAVASLRRQLAVELGAYGIRVVTLKTGGIPETIPPDMPGREEITAAIQEATLLKRPATLADVAAVAVFAASDQARAITGTEINLSAGAIIE